jgi:Iap family predicted aminopeptidase
MKTVMYLASKECAGRLPGHVGYTKAAQYMATEFAKLQLEPLGDSVYFQNIKIDSVEVSQQSKLNSMEAWNLRRKYTDGNCEIEKSTMNVIGLIKGSDPIMKNEFVVIGAHLDHLGEEAEGIYNPGANDNASGCASVLEIANVFKKNSIITRRSIIFTLFTGEEEGSIGANYFVKNSPVPIDNIIVMINLDCIGYGEEVQIDGSPNLWELFIKIDSMSPIGMTKIPYCDDKPFHEKGIPTVSFTSSDGCGPYYHTPNDTPETLSKETLEKVTKLAYMTVYEIAIGNYLRNRVNK